MANTTAVPALVGREEFLIMIEFVYHIWMVILIFGIVSNIINIVVFCGLGDRDNVSTSMLVLSLSDLSYLVIRALTTGARFVLYHHQTVQWLLDPKIFLACIYWYGQVFYDFSCFIALFMSVVRCCCVVMPLRFKSVFTRSRTVTALIGLFLSATCLRTPQFFAHGFIWKVNPATNSTYLSCSDAKDIQILAKINDIVNRNIVSSVAYITVAVCVVTMIITLKASSRFRNSASKPSASTNVGQGKPSKDLEKMSAKELQLIQSVILLSIIFLLSQLPFQIYYTIRLFVPEFDTYRSQVYLFGIASHISTTFSFLNCSINIFVYLTYNRKYRAAACSLLCLKTE
ncbi:hypothetical protein EGW08_004597 [Elysia chlorotica]|uniref:G-protein coupled receptors family 1 profile domain-containing protein n=1 Tax=Elysia chlorotica TaxID=188477 RepID=A0A433U1E9_ELYCH|nr:hypothetical protein EGW08_004597 [Elysia chlorotica]